MRTLLLLLCSLFVPSIASAHVYITEPAEGAVISPGAAVTIAWEIAVNHGPPDTYDLMYSLDGGAMYRMIEEGLPGTPSVYEWTAPDVNAPDAVLSIVQHGSGGYTYMHSVPIQIGAAGGDDMGTTPDMGMPDGELFAPPEADTPTEAIDDLPTTGAEVEALLEKRCAMSGCHAAEQPQAGLDLTPSAFPESVVGVKSSLQADSTLVPACNSASSELVRRLRGERSLIMPPPPEPVLTDGQITAILDWIDGGAAVDDEPFGAPCVADDNGEDDGGCSTASASPWGLFLVMLLVVARTQRRTVVRRTRS